MANICSRLIELREIHDLSRLDLAKKLGVNKSTIARYETDIMRPDLDVMIKIHDIFDVSLDWLVGLTDKMR